MRFYHALGWGVPAVLLGEVLPTQACGPQPLPILGSPNPILIPQPLPPCHLLREGPVSFPYEGSELDHTSLVLPLLFPKALLLGWIQMAMGTLTSAGSPSMSPLSGVLLALSSLSLW